MIFLLTELSGLVKLFSVIDLVSLANSCVPGMPVFSFTSFYEILQCLLIDYKYYLIQLRFI